MESEYPLERSWVIWEMWNTTDTSNYSSNMNSIGSFSTMWDFLQHWENLPHSTPDFYFTDSKNNQEKIIENLQYSIEAIGVFVKDVIPAWEDPVNAVGSDFSVRKSMQDDASTLREIWKKLVYSLIGETIPYSECVVGVRIVDKLKFFKAEIWVNFNATEELEKKITIINWISDFFKFKPEDISTNYHGTKYKKT